MVTRDDTARAVEAIWRIESARVIGGLVRMLRDLTLAEDLAQEALIAALESWPSAGIPDNPGAWLMATAKRRAIDQLRRRKLLDRKHAMLGEDALRDTAHPDEAWEVDEDVGDDVLRLMLISCHPVLPPEARVALTLRLLGGLSTDEIARAYLLPEPTVAQRIVRAKRTLTEARVPFEMPQGEDLAARIPSVLEAIYLIFNEGYAATRGDELLRHALCEDAMRLARMLAQRLPAEAEAQGLIALLELQASRARARVDARGDPVLLLEQDRSRWDALLIHRGLAALAQAESLAQPLGPYTLQAAIAACHARAHTADATDWQRIVALYDALAELTQSPVVELNRAVAISMADGPAAALDVADALVGEPALRNYHLLPAARADFLWKLGRRDEARQEFERAASMTRNERERALLLARARQA